MNLPHACKDNGDDDIFALLEEQEKKLSEICTIQRSIGIVFISPRDARCFSPFLEN